MKKILQLMLIVTLISATTGYAVWPFDQISNWYKNRQMEKAYMQNVVKPMSQNIYNWADKKIAEINEDLKEYPSPQFRGDREKQLEILETMKKTPNVFLFGDRMRTRLKLAGASKLPDPWSTNYKLINDLEEKANLEVDGQKLYETLQKKAKKRYETTDRIKNILRGYNLSRKMMQ